MRVRLELPGDPTSVRQARRLVARTLREWDLDDLEEFASLLVSEVVTNAVLHARTDLAVEVRLDGAVVRILVSDCADRQPQRRRHGTHAGTGRGLGLVEALSTAWGTDPAVDPYRKTVWFELPLDPQDLPAPGEVVV